MKTKLAQYFMNKGYYFQKVPLKEDTELMISNQQYDAIVQFQWTSFHKTLSLKFILVHIFQFALANMPFHFRA